jgi:hypothetical protein
MPGRALGRRLWLGAPRCCHVNWLDQAALRGLVGCSRRTWRGLNQGTFDGTVLNQGNIGKTADELVAQWNAEHPDDPVKG